jgi:hypothetical protein
MRHVETSRDLSARWLSTSYPCFSPLPFHTSLVRKTLIPFSQGAKHWDAVNKWDGPYLRRVLRGKKVRVATTPKGNADAVVTSTDGTLLFAEPHEVTEDFGSFLDYVQENATGSSNVKYAQPRE